MKNSKPITILMADDDPDDRLLVQEAFEENRLVNNLETVEDGEELMDFLHRRGKFANTDYYPRLDFIRFEYAKEKWFGSLERNQIGSQNYAVCRLLF